MIEDQQLPRLAVAEVSTPSAGNANMNRWQFTFHEILPNDSNYRYRVTPTDFEKHLAFFAAMPKTFSSPPTVHISFDDGHRSNYENAFPVLERYGLKATFFVLAGMLGKDSNFLTWPQVREMAAAGHQVASHGWSHRLLTQCDYQELDLELKNSKREIEDQLGLEVDAISVPGGRWNSRVVDVCADASYRRFFHSNPWVARRVLRGLQLQGRHMMTSKMGPQEVQSLLTMGMTKRAAESAIYFAKERVREALGDRLYHKLWCWVANWNPEDGMEVNVDKQAGGEVRPL